MYSIHGAGNSRVLEVDNASMQSRRFKQIIDGNVTAVTFKRVSATKSLAVVSDQVQVYRKPNHIHYHNEVMQASRNLQSLASTKHIDPVLRDSMTVDYDGILDNMLEFDEVI